MTTIHRARVTTIVIRLLLLAALGLAWPVQAAAQSVYGDRFIFTAGPREVAGSGSPEGVVTAAVGSVYRDTSSGQLYRKASGSGTTGWTLIAGVAGSGTTNTIPKWSGSTTLGDAPMTTDGTNMRLSGALEFGADVSLARSAANKVGLASGDALETAYSAGWAGAGYHLDYNQSYASKSFLELDHLSVRGTLNVYELLAHQIRATNGSIYVSSTGKIKTATYTGGVSYDFETEAVHGFAVNDLVRAQRFTGTGTYVVEMTVTAVPDTTHFTGAVGGSSSAIPTAGMDFVRIGNTGTASRQNSIFLTADDTNNPYLSVLAGVSAFAEWGTAAKTKLRLGNLNGSYDYASDIYGLGVGASTGDALTVDPTNGIRFLNNGTLYGSLSSSAWTLGRVAAGQSNVAISAGAVALRNNTTERIRLNADGSGFLANSNISWNTSGVMTMAAGYVGGWYIGPACLSSDGGATAFCSGSTSYRLWIGDTTPANAEFYVTDAGLVHAVSGDIGGFSLSTSALYAGTGATRVEMSTANGIHAGATAFADAPFKVSLAGALTATNATLTGSLSAAGGDVTINGSGIAIASGTASTNKITFSDGGEISSYTDELHLYSDGKVVTHHGGASVVWQGNRVWPAASGFDLGASSDPFYDLYLSHGFQVSGYAGGGDLKLCVNNSGNSYTCGAPEPEGAWAALRAEIGLLRSEVAELRAHIALILGGVK